MMRRKASIAIVLLMFCVCGCTVGPNYKRPDVNDPVGYRGLPNESSVQSGSETFAEMKLAAVFPDEVLQSLLKEALVNNYDVRIAATRVLQAGADLGITRANQLPTVDVAGGIQNQRMQPLSGNVTAGAVAVQASWILDFWGQFRRATEAARANLLATEYAQGLVRLTLISAVANAYFQLRAFDSQLVTSERTLDADKEIVRINTIKFKGGESAITDVLQAQLLQEQAEAEIISLKQGIEQTENQISILLARNPGPVVRGLSLTQQPHMPEVPAGLPSSILERRPDVLQSEQSLVAANANVGVAKAAFFPQFSLTGAFGVQSTALESFLGGPTTAAWLAAGQV